MPVPALPYLGACARRSDSAWCTGIARADLEAVQQGQPQLFRIGFSRRVGQAVVFPETGIFELGLQPVVDAVGDREIELLAVVDAALVRLEHMVFAAELQRRQR